MRRSLRAFLFASAAFAVACGQPAEASRAAPALPSAAAAPAAVTEADGTSELTIEWRGVI